MWPDLRNMIATTDTQRVTGFKDMLRPVGSDGASMPASTTSPHGSLNLDVSKSHVKGGSLHKECLRMFGA